MARLVPPAGVALAALILAAGAAASGVGIAGLDSWRSFTLPGVPETLFTAAPDGTIRVTARRSFGLRYVELPAASAARRYLSWCWRIDALEEGPVAATALHDDRALALHLWFPEAPHRGTFLHRLRRAAAGLLGRPLPGHILTYSWGGVGPSGGFYPNPALPEEGRVRILRRAADGLATWRAERVDIAADFERAFGFRGPPPSHLALSADMEDTGGASVAEIAEIGFTDDRPEP